MMGLGHPQPLINRNVLDQSEAFYLPNNNASQLNQLDNPEHMNNNAINLAFPSSSN